MEYYKLRVDYNKNDQVYRNMESNYFVSYVRAFERGGDETNPHFHYYVEMICSSVSLRQYIRKNIGSGNGVYSLKKLDEEKPVEYLAYLMKEDGNTIWYKMPVELKTVVIEYDLKVKESMKNKGRKTTLVKIEDYIVKKYGKMLRNKEQLVEEVCNYHVDNQLQLRMFNIQSICETIWFRNNPDYRKRYIDNIVSRIY